MAGMPLASSIQSRPTGKSTSPAELVSHLVQVVSGAVELRLHVATAAVELRLHGLHLVAGQSQSPLQLLVLLLQHPGKQAAQ